MRLTRIPVTVLAASLALVLPVAVFAQEASEPYASDAEPTPEPDPSMTPPPLPEPAATEGGENAPKTTADRYEGSHDFGGAADAKDMAGVGVQADHHTVERGDTLWDISGKYLGNPWYWPKVWSYNPEIENPHWIYPGDDVRFYPDDGKGDEGGEKKELDDVSKGDFNRPDYGEDDDVTTSGKVGYSGPRTLLARADGFVTEKELAESGTIAKSFSESDLLSDGDRIYVEWPNRKTVRPGEQYVIYRTQRELWHPVDDYQVGFVTEIVGNARVIAADPKEKYVTATIDKTFTEVQRGDYIGPPGARAARRVSRKPNQVNIVGRVISALEPGSTQMAPWALIFLDKGRRDGVEEGNTFDVLRSGDGTEYEGYEPQYDAELPFEKIGQVMVIDTKESASSAVVVYSIRELHSGDRIRMVAAKK